MEEISTTNPEYKPLQKFNDALCAPMLEKPLLCQESLTQSRSFFPVLYTYHVFFLPSRTFLHMDCFFIVYTMYFLLFSSHTFSLVCGSLHERSNHFSSIALVLTLVKYPTSITFSSPLGRPILNYKVVVVKLEILYHISLIKNA